MFERVASRGFAPSCARRFRDQAQLGFLVSLGDEIPFLHRCRAAWRAQDEPFERLDALYLINSPFELLLAFQRGSFRTNQARNDSPILRHIGERFESSRTL
jgi:hypothetical protein